MERSLKCISSHMTEINLQKRLLLNPSIFDLGKVKRGAFAAGRKITRIISFSKKKPPRPGDPRTAYSDPRQGQTPFCCHPPGHRACICIIILSLLTMQAACQCWWTKCGGNSGAVCAEAPCSSTMTEETLGPPCPPFLSMAARWCQGWDLNIPLPSESCGPAQSWLLWRCKTVYLFLILKLHRSILLY